MATSGLKCSSSGGGVEARVEHEDTPRNHLGSSSAETSM
eukprot:CAMPEP_0172857986 /NCGR_PEP_ID=MMETSP1075-20121228/65346_1 /TAXON_ID=2916 /ORGANISM="Ceratium fusus, Strain PA161109" /LENGTH=38 /DNA_ID= /DNA_START= /DNA_END= /DNA_ORIENTATION=